MHFCFVADLGRPVRCLPVAVVRHKLIQLVPLLFFFFFFCWLSCQCTNVITMGADVGALLVDSGWLFVGLPKVVKVRQNGNESPLKRRHP